MRGWVLLLALALPVSGCSKDASAIYTAKAMAKEQLKDPSSARFRGEYVVRRPPDAKGLMEVAVCGLIDGKNGFGAYSGGTRYVAHGFDGSSGQSMFDVIVDDGSKRSMEPGEETTFEKVYWNPSCTDANHPPMKTGEGADAL